MSILKIATVMIRFSAPKAIILFWKFEGKARVIKYYIGLISVAISNTVFASLRTWIKTGEDSKTGFLTTNFCVKSVSLHEPTDGKLGPITVPVCLVLCDQWTQGTDYRISLTFKVLKRHCWNRAMGAYLKEHIQKDALIGMAMGTKSNYYSTTVNRREHLRTLKVGMLWD